MLKTLTLTNYRKVENSTINFVSGLNVFRGESEAGKSTRLEAVMYALFGSKGLKEPLAKVVTYDKPEASLKVELDFCIDGVDYNITRSKAGAELRYSDAVVTGQTETRLFVERLLGCSTDVAKLLMVADQNSVRGVLASGGAAAGNLVEKLAELEVIETLIDKVQHELPSGNTKALEAQVATLEEGLNQIPERPEASLQSAKAAQNRLSKASTHKDNLKSLWAISAINLLATQLELARLSTHLMKRKSALQQAEKLQQESVGPTPPPFTESDLTEARRIASDEAALAKRRKAYDTKFPVCSVSWDGTMDEMLTAEMLAEEKKIAGQAQMVSLRTGLATLAATRINEKECAFCKKDISALPEVASINERVSQQEGQLAASVVELKNTLGLLDVELASYKKLKGTTQAILNLTSDYWSLSDAVPPKPTWIGLPPEPSGTTVDLSGMESTLKSYAVKVAKAQAAKEQLAVLEIPDEVDTKPLEDKIWNFKKEEERLKEAEKEVASLEAEYKAAQAVADSDMRIYAHTLETSKEQVRIMKSTLSDMYKHNELVKALRGARPQITAQLWNTVLGAVSHYFTTIRGTHSILTRTAEGFAVNGRSVEGLSGSTQDALGLAIRIALSKTFLPNVPLLVVDEPFSGCDQNRELSGLGLLASAGFEQVILITHSNLADSLADNLIAL